MNVTKKKLNIVYKLLIEKVPLYTYNELRFYWFILFMKTKK